MTPHQTPRAAGDRTSITWPDTVAISYDYDVLQRARHILLGSYTVAVYSGACPRAGRRTDPGNDHGRRSGITRANSGGAPTSYAYDGADRISTLTQSLTGTAAVTYTQGYDPASETVSSQVSNSSVLFHDPTTSTSYTADGLDRYATVGGLTPTYDGRQNLFDLSSTSPHFTYDTENNLLTGSGPTAMTLVRDALGRIQTKTVGGTSETFLYSGAMLVGEYDGSGNVLARYVPGPGTDEAMVWYAGAGTTMPQWLHADPLGSTIAWSNSAGGSLGTQAYDPFGQPASWSGARFAYTGQLMLGEAQLYDYKARAYNPSLGRFMQTDPAGQASDLNPYAYVGNEPLGLTDPSGMVECFICTRVVATGSAAATASDVGSSDPSSWADIPECEAGSPASSCQVIVRATPTGAPTTQLSFGDLPSFGGPNSGGGGGGEGGEMARLHQLQCTVLGPVGAAARGVGGVVQNVGNAETYIGLGVGGAGIAAGVAGASTGNVPLAGFGALAAEAGAGFAAEGEAISKTGGLISAIGGNYSALATDPLSKLVSKLPIGRLVIAAVNKAVERALEPVSRTLNCK